MEKIAHTLFDNKLPFTLIVTLIILAHLLWDHFNGGVPSHYLLHDPTMPSFSNWLGLLIVPALTYLCIHWIQKNKTSANAETIAYGFFGALVFGLFSSVLWEFDQEAILQYSILLPVVLALFIPMHRAEIVLGFILGMYYTFGGVLPILFVVVLGFMSFVVYQVAQFIRGLLRK